VAGWRENPPYAFWSDGAYRLQARQAARYVALAAPITNVPSNVLVVATFRKTGGPPGGGYGLLIHDQTPEPPDGVNQALAAYVFEVGDLGEFGIWRRDGERWVDLMPWTKSAAIRTGGSPNDLAVATSGPRMTFSVNGTEVASIQDAALSGGRVGVFVGGDMNEVALDHFAIAPSET
jgi:hypothetical protein